MHNFNFAIVFILSLVAIVLLGSITVFTLIVIDIIKTDIVVKLISTVGLIMTGYTIRTIIKT